jgi:hypothetical protein
VAEDIKEEEAKEEEEEEEEEGKGRGREEEGRAEGSSGASSPTIVTTRPTGSTLCCFVFKLFR